MKALTMNIIEPAATQSEREANQQWIAKYGLYNYLTRNSALAEENTTMSDFGAENEQSNIGKLQRAIAAFSQTEVGIGQQEAAELNSIQPTNSVEQTLKDVLTILYSNVTDLRTLSEETEQLREIARRCPLDDGMGVYMARAALLSVDTLPKDYANECERIPGLEEAKNKTTLEKEEVFGVFPNPNNGSMTVTYDLEESEIGKLEIFDPAGRKVFSTDLTFGSSSVVINVPFLNAGVYICQVKINGNIEMSSQISVIK